ncbi:phosphopantetheine-binding protein [Kitasatospora sp. NPDC048540]|uniref:acyl carrier protein n=1 Tax=unclassified Kitasatospora TaxID=2633591 RepID=UPI00053979B1|nr:phosphopantetheine-binding protein [Kitasatospora sp. MBT63]
MSYAPGPDKFIIAVLVDIIRDYLGLTVASGTAAGRSIPLDLDSLSQVEFAVGIENRFAITLTDDETRSLTTLGNAVEIIRTKQHPTAPAAPPRHGNGGSPPHP